VRSPWAWLHTVVRRRVARCVPAAARRAHGEPALHAEQGAVRWSTAAPAAGAEDFAAAREVTALIRRMPQRRRQQVAYLRYVLGWDFTEIAEQLGCRPATARVHALRARRCVAELAALGCGVDEATVVADDPEGGCTTVGTALVAPVVPLLLAAAFRVGPPYVLAALAGVLTACWWLAGRSVGAPVVEEEGQGPAGQGLGGAGGLGGGHVPREFAHGDEAGAAQAAALPGGDGEGGGVAHGAAVEDQAEALQVAVTGRVGGR
ncbi:sigma factor-like helix-turn-helix DNA-binding protein, partial [Streptomyces sp. CBMA123]|uniref:sigma-70 region 4 domain-containing protein n=1 Tax=Streptomyces sp. CBMA123 TaxID=1896313 RepID=UPI001CB86A90